MKTSKKPTEPKLGRPTLLTPTLADAICLKLAEGKSLLEICKSARMPHRNTVMRWAAENEDFRGMYARARDEGCDAIAEEAVAIARRPVEDMVDVARNRLAYDAHCWYAGKIKPKVYGNRQQVDVEGKLTLEQLVAASHPGGDADSG
jgi:hypothetical protein